ncbi:hypothetical protein NQ315_007284, partial [Exocentrus adspersus]
GFFCKGWCEEWVVLYEDSTLAWYSDKGLGRPRGHVRIGDAPELLAVGEWTRQVPKRPRFPFSCHVGQLLAIGSRTVRDVHWLMAQSPAEINDWMTAISNTLPPPPHLPLDNKRLSLTPQQKNGAVPDGRCVVANGCATTVRNGSCSRPNVPSSTSKKPVSCRYDNDYTVLSGVCIDWGHGWGWGQNHWASQPACHETAAVASSIYYHSGDDYGVGGYDECDWSAFGDFSF